MKAIAVARELLIAIKNLAEIYKNENEWLASELMKRREEIKQLTLRLEGEK